MNTLLVQNVRPATQNDVEQMAKIYNRSFPEHIMVQRGLLNNPDYLSKHIQNPDEHWVVEGENGIIRGVAALAISPPVGLGEIERVCVDRQQRGRGLAQHLCRFLVNEAVNFGLGFVEAFARGDQPGMQRTFEKLGFKVYGVAPRFEVIHDGRVVREQFVHMGLELKPETIDTQNMLLIQEAAELYRLINK